MTSTADSSERSILYYISGHGFGHATRSVEVIKAIHRLRPDIPVHVRSWAPAPVFNGIMKKIRLSYARYDVGVVQSDGITMDIPATLHKMEDTLKDADRCICAEVAMARDIRAGCIVSDIPPIAHRVADHLEIPSLAVTNFSWDWIYEDWQKDYCLAGSLAEKMRSDYRLCRLLLRLPYSEDLPAFTHTEKIPMLGRRAVLPREIVLERAGLKNDSRPIVLLSFGGMGLNAGRLPGLHGNTTYQLVSTFSLNNPGVTILPDLETCNISYPDLVGAVDIIITKPGYGIVSECAVNHTRMLYTDRGRFREYDVILKELPYWNCSRYISRERLLSGNWTEELDQLMHQNPENVPGAKEASAAPGAAAAAERIVAYYETGRN